MRDDIRRALWVRGAFLDEQAAEHEDVRNALERLRAYVGIETDAFGVRMLR